MKKFLSTLLCCGMLSCGLGAVAPVDAASDPWDSYTPVTAVFEDSELGLWFEHSTAKVQPENTESSGMNTYCIRSAKNEIETCQFVLFAENGRTGLTAQITDFSNEAGDILTPELFSEHYMDIGGGKVNPDALPPLTSAFNLTAGKSQAFLIKIKVPADATAGVYTATLTIKNSDGEDIKTAVVFLKVWDFTLPEATSCATSMNLDIGRLIQYHPGVKSSTLYETYYDFLLENRISAYYLPQSIFSDKADVYLNNPRVTSFQYANVSGQALGSAAMRRAYQKLAANPEWFEKGYFFSTEDPVNMDILKKISDKYAEIDSKLSTVIPEGRYPRFNYLSTFFTDFEVSDGVDEIDYLDDYVSVWVPKPFAFTKASDIGTVPGAKLLQDTKWDSVYGTFSDRMAAYKDRGDKVWWFISWDVEEPYANYFTQTDGVTHRVLFWQQKDCGVDGFLYNSVNFWYNGDPWEVSETNTKYPGVYGDGVLVYPGARLGIDGPVSSLRLEAMRDGIEDFEYLTMLEEKLGTAAAKKYISMVSESVTTYTHDENVFAEARIALGDAVEKAMNSTAPAMMGDVNGDGKVNSTDIALLKRAVSGAIVLDDNAKFVSDINGDSRINAGDILMIKRHIAGLISLS